MGSHPKFSYEIRLFCPLSVPASHLIGISFLSTRLALHPIPNAHGLQDAQCHRQPLHDAHADGDHHPELYRHTHLNSNGNTQHHPHAGLLGPCHRFICTMFWPQVGGYPGGLVGGWVGVLNDLNLPTAYEPQPGQPAL